MEQAGEWEQVKGGTEGGWSGGKEWGGEKGVEGGMGELPYTSRFHL